jgi:hypothetical protein
MDMELKLGGQVVHFDCFRRDLCIKESVCPLDVHAEAVSPLARNDHLASQN